MACNLQIGDGARERSARGGSWLAIGSGSWLAISRSGARERQARGWGGCARRGQLGVARGGSSERAEREQRVREQR